MYSPTFDRMKTLTRQTLPTITVIGLAVLYADQG